MEFFFSYLIINEFEFIRISSSACCVCLTALFRVRWIPSLSTARRRPPLPPMAPTIVLPIVRAAVQPGLPLRGPRRSPTRRTLTHNLLSTDCTNQTAAKEMVSNISASLASLGRPQNYTSTVLFYLIWNLFHCAGFLGLYFNLPFTHALSNYSCCYSFSVITIVLPVWACQR